ncbi:MAG: LiaF domain-containing protein [Candidatus Thorarchaeota archaeon]
MTERNNTMIACILAFIIVGAIGVGAISLWGGGNGWDFNWNLDINVPDWENTTTYTFDLTDASMPATVTLNFDITVGAVSVVFTDDATLVYDIEVIVPNATIELHGDPVVTYTADTIGLDYEVAGVNVTLGSGTTYVMDVDVTTGAISVVLTADADVGDISLDTTTGAISLAMTSTVTLTGNVTFDLGTTTGGIDVVIALPSGVGGSFTGTSTVGGVDVNETGWDLVSTNHYETSDYDTASQTLTIITSVTTGAIGAVLS